jgi:hypothetical protein
VEDATVIPVGEPEEETSNTRKETMACQEMEERLEEEKPTSVDRKPEVAQEREVTVEAAVVKPVNGRKKRQRSKWQAAARRGEPKKLTRGDCGSRMKLATACRKVPRRATVAWRKRIILRKSSTQRNCGPRKEVTAAGIKITRCAGHRRMDKKKVTQRKRRRFQSSQEGPPVEQGRRKNRTRNRSTRGIRKMILYEIVGRKIAKQIAGSSVGLRQDKDWTLWRGRPPSKTEKKRLQAEEEEPVM